MLLFLYLLHMVCTLQDLWTFKMIQYLHTCAHTTCPMLGTRLPASLPCIPHDHSPVQPGQRAAARQSCRHPATWTGTPGSVLRSQEAHPWVWFHCSSPPPWSAVTLYATDWEDKSSLPKIKLCKILKCVEMNGQVHSSPPEKCTFVSVHPPITSFSCLKQLSSDTLREYGYTCINTCMWFLY